MRVVLKPAGVIAALVVIGYMVLTILTYTRESQSADGLPAPTPVPATPAPIRQFANGGFEKPFGTARIMDPSSGLNARVSGELASGWEDQSNGSTTTVVYAPDSAKPHGGKLSQRIELKSAATKGDGAQICQMVTISRGRVYRVSGWLRAKDDTKAVLTLRPDKKDIRVKEAAQQFEIGTAWKKISIELDARDMTVNTADALLMIGIHSAKTTVWVDDVDFTETRKN